MGVVVVMGRYYWSGLFKYVLFSPKTLFIAHANRITYTLTRSIPHAEQLYQDVQVQRCVLPADQSLWAVHAHRQLLFPYLPYPAGMVWYGAHFLVWSLYEGSISFTRAHFNLTRISSLANSLTISILAYPCHFLTEPCDHGPSARFRAYRHRCQGCIRRLCMTILILYAASNRGIFSSNDFSWTIISHFFCKYLLVLDLHILHLTTQTLHWLTRILRAATRAIAWSTTV